jgi:hypothetical protein
MPIFPITGLMSGSCVSTGFAAVDVVVGPGADVDCDVSSCSKITKSVRPFVSLLSTILETQTLVCSMDLWARVDLEFPRGQTGSVCIVLIASKLNTLNSTDSGYTCLRATYQYLITSESEKQICKASASLGWAALNCSREVLISTVPSGAECMEADILSVVVREGI